jgi:hypothetical protein
VAISGKILTVRLLKRETPDFITPSLWRPESPDLSPVDYKIWGLLQQRVYTRKVRNVEEQHQHIREEWERLTRSNNGVGVSAHAWL